MPSAETTTTPTGARLQRTFTLTVETPPGGLSDARVAVCLSSEAPVERYDMITGSTYLEVLDHGPNGIDWTHAEDRTIPFLLDHDIGRQIGLITDVRVDSDRRLRGTIQFGNHPDAEWIARDIAAGIRNKVSVGYHQGRDVEHVRPKRSGDIPTRRFLGWKLLEASSVAIPANPDVGIGRSAPLAQPAPSGATTHRSPMNDHEHTSTREAELAVISTEAGLSHRLADWITGGTTVESARTEAWAKLKANAPAPFAPYNPNDAIASRAYAAPQDAPDIAAFASPDSAAARNTTATLSRDMGFAPRMGGHYIPLDVSRLNTPTHSRVLTTTGSTSGAELVPRVQMAFTDRLREEMLAPNVGVRFLQMSGGAPAFPVATTDPTVVELAENPGSGASLSDPAFATRVANPKAAVIRSAISNQIGLASTPEAVATVSQIMARTLAYHMDGRIFAGPTGGNGPVGAFFSTGVTTHGLGATGAALDYAGLVACEKALVDARGEAEDTIVITTSSVRAELQQTQDFPTASAGRPLWENGRVMGRQAYSRAWMPSTLTKSTGTGLHGLLMYSPRQAGHLVVTWPAVEITVDRLTGADKQLTYITAALYYDVVVLHPGAVVRIADIDVS